MRVAGIVAFIVMKSIALASRFKPKDAYDIHFCLENYPDGLPGLVREFTPFLGEPIVREGLAKLAASGTGSRLARGRRRRDLAARAGARQGDRSPRLRILRNVRRPARPGR